eukprot:3941403-Rhodomonas_salina.8
MEWVIGQLGWTFIGGSEMGDAHSEAWELLSRRSIGCSPELKRDAASSTLCFLAFRFAGSLSLCLCWPGPAWSLLIGD